MKKQAIYTLDAFCGGGGVSSGMHEAAKDLGLNLISVAINHWDIAVQTMHTNHKSIKALRMSMESAEPTDLFPGRVIHLAWASPSCTHHSRAKGGQPRQNQSRCQPYTIYPFIDECDVRRIIVENVPEFKEWAPLDSEGHPIKSSIKEFIVKKNGKLVKEKMGSSFKNWIEGIIDRGYTVDWRVVNCADYGDATTRHRLFIKAVKKGYGKIVWPEPTHAEFPDDDLFGRKLKRWRAIGDCIDFSDIGHSIFNRKKPLVDKTMTRIADGMQKYCGIDLNPFLIKLRNNGKSASVDKPIDTITAGGTHFALCQPFIVKSKKNQKTESVGKPISSVCAHTVHHALCQPIIIEHTRNGKAAKTDGPLGTVTTKEHYSIVRAFVMDHFKGGGAIPVDKPIGTQTTHGRYSILTPLILGQQGGAKCHPANKPCPTIATAGAVRVIMPFVVDNANGGIVRSSDKPINTVTVKDQHMGIFPMLEDGRIIDIFMRMLKPKELAAAHSFPDDYVFCGTKTEQHKQIGNSVPVNTAKAMCEADLRQIAKEVKRK